MRVLKNINYSRISNSFKDVPFKINHSSSYIPLYSINTYDKYHFTSALQNVMLQVNNNANTLNTDNLYSYAEGNDVALSIYKLLNSNVTDLKFNSSIKTGTYNNIILNPMPRYGYAHSNLNSIGVNLYLSLHNCVIHYNPSDDMYTPLWMMVIKKDYIKYARQCSLLGKPIHKDCVKLLVNEELDVTRGVYNLIRSRYRKHIKKECIDAGVEIETVANFDEVLNRIELPKAISVNGYVKKLNELGSEFLNDFKELEKYEDFELTF